MSWFYAGSYEQAIFGSNSVLAVSSQVTVYEYGTTTAAVLWTDWTKSTQAANPTTTSAVGMLQFYADPGMYTLSIVINGTTSTVNVEVRPSSLDGGEQSGFLKEWVGSSTSVPFGWLIADGSAVSRTTYASLFGTVGTTFGVGDGQTTFNLPNLHDQVTVGAGNLYALGAYVGASNISLAVGNIPSHNHGDSGHTHGNTSTESVEHNHADSGHDHATVSSNVAVYTQSSTLSLYTAADAGAGTQVTYGAMTTGSGNANLGGENVLHVHAVPTGNAAITDTGSGTAFSVLQASVGVWKLIKV
ncbi:MAG: phage tail protein [Ferrimicrobium sp.]